MNLNNSDIIVIGGGIIGTATALSLKNKHNLNIIIIETEKELASHQTGNNSGVIHSGLYYKPGSLKAKNCTEGRDLLYHFCEEHNIKFERCGKLVIAIDKSQLAAMEELYNRGKKVGRLKRDANLFHLKIITVNWLWKQQKVNLKQSFLLTVEGCIVI
ncbi:MAG: FAD-dependent oxidoreductase [Ignavibacteriaceae bacterium]